MRFHDLNGAGGALGEDETFEYGTEIAGADGMLDLIFSH